MKLSRRQFMIQSARVGAFAASMGLGCGCMTGMGRGNQEKRQEKAAKRRIKADLAVLGGSLGGVAAALAALEKGLQVVLTEETDWIGGQLTSQAVPPDEHRWIESFGAPASYRRLRQEIRAYYRKHYRLTPAVQDNDLFNPGNGLVSRLCHEPRVALQVLESKLLPYLLNQQLTLWLEHRPVQADTQSDQIQSVTVMSLTNGIHRTIEADYYVDATELGDVLPLAEVEHVTGAESRNETGELHAVEKSDPLNQQAFTTCFVLGYDPKADHVIDRPKEYSFWRDYVPSLDPPWPGKWLDFTYTHPSTGEPRRLGFHPSGSDPNGILNLWKYRRLVDANQFQPGFYRSDLSLVNWPQNDYLLGPLTGPGAEKTRQHHIERSRQLSLSLLYWLQTEAPRPDGGSGWPGLHLCAEQTGTSDGLAKHPYIRESRRIRAVTTVREQDCGREQRAVITGTTPLKARAERYFDSVGVGHYQIDLHPSTGGDNYIDFPALPFQIPLGALLPIRLKNLLCACKNVGTTHVTNGCYRLHPAEWNMGEAAGALAAFSHIKRVPLSSVREQMGLLEEFQTTLRDQGVELEWPESIG